MRLLAVLENPWCLTSVLLLIVLLVVAAALVSRERARAAGVRQPLQATAPRPPRLHQITATAPFEALQALGERLAEIQRHLPPGSEDARWLQSYRNDLRNVQDDVYWGLFSASDSDRTHLLQRLDKEVGQLERIVGERLSATLSATTDRSALHAQLDQLRQVVSR